MALSLLTVVFVRRPFAILGPIFSFLYLIWVPAKWVGTKVTIYTRRCMLRGESLTGMKPLAEG